MVTLDVLSLNGLLQRFLMLLRSSCLFSQKNTPILWDGEMEKMLTTDVFDTAQRSLLETLAPHPLGNFF